MKKILSSLMEKNIFKTILKSDLTKEYLEKINSKLNNFLETGKLPVNDTDLKEYYLSNLKSKNSILLQYVKKNGRRIEIVLCQILTGLIEDVLMEDLIWTNNKKLSGSGSEVLNLIQKYVFEELNLNSIFTGVVSSTSHQLKVI